MKYINLETLEVKSQGEIRKDNVNMRLPRVFTDNVLTLLNIAPVFETPKPTVSIVQRVIADGVEQDTKGNWVEKWKIVDAFSDYTTDEGVLVTKAEQEAEAVLNQLNTAKEAKRNAIRSAFNAASQLPVTLADGSVWNGGMDSALAIDGAVRMAENAGLTDLTLYDANNTAHAVSITDGKLIAAGVGAVYQSVFANKQAKMVAIEAAATLEEIEAVVWEVV